MRVIRSAAGLAVFGVAVAAGCAASAGTYQFSYSAPGVTASGTITTSGAAPATRYTCATCVSGPGEMVVSVTGVRNGAPITGPVPVNTVDGNDNVFYPQAPYL